ncbi:MAG: 23S rRNA (pseudouridine(1915)-N(3))-methyltransferase RlmH [Pseudomonadota bacterium]
MRISLLAVGSMKTGPERALVDDYISRASKLARPLGIRGVQEIEVRDGGGTAAEAARLIDKCPEAAQIILLDEFGDTPRSTDLARSLERWRDDGCSHLCFLIGGADGHGEAAKAAAGSRLAFGPQTWPHRLVRVMLAEQVYRALSILAGTPYHKA